MPEIEELLIKTKNVQLSLTQYAQENNLNTKECDFSLKKVEFLLKDISSRDFNHINKEKLKKYLDKEKILNEHIEFSQIYTILLHPKKKSKIALAYVVKRDVYNAQPYIIISPKSRLAHKHLTQKEMLIVLYKEINKIKLLHGILIHLFDAQMKQQLSTLIKHIYTDKFTKNIKISLFSGIQPIITKEAKLIYWYKEKSSSSQVIEVDKDELLIEYKKPTFGANGLNAQGNMISMEAADNETLLDIDIDIATIKIDEDDKSIAYRSMQQGFVHFEKNILSIDNKIKLSTISRNTTALATEEDNNIEIIVAQNDTNQDSVGEGVELISELIHINGFVGAKSKLEAVNLVIDGATHQSSTQIAKYATIHRHKGSLRCHEAKIDLLEGGEVTGSKVTVESSLGGTIYAVDVTVGHVKSNLKIYASNSISIRLVSGEDNLFAINYKKIPILCSKLDFLTADIKNLQDEFDEIKDSRPEEAKSIKTNMKSLEAQKDLIFNSYERAIISIDKPLHGLNNIIFSIDEKNELTFKTEAKSYEPFHLEIDENTITLLPCNTSIEIE